MNLKTTEFKRKFSMSMYKNLRLSMAEMSFSKDFVNDTPLPCIRRYCKTVFLSVFPVCDL